MRIQPAQKYARRHRLPLFALPLSISPRSVADRQQADCRRRNSPLPRSTRPFMTAIDFAAFVDELAAVSGETIRPFFRSALGVENKSRSGGFDPVTAADRAAEAAMRALIKRTFPGARRRRRRARRRSSRRRICLGARPDRRHQIVHLRPAGLGHADRADAGRRADLRHDAPAVHAGAFFRRRPRRALSRAGRRPRAAGAALR